MNSRFGRIFNISVAGGILGLAFADSISGDSGSWIGFCVGMLGTFTFFSGLAVISEAVQFRSNSEATQLINKLNEVLSSQSLTEVTNKKAQQNVERRKSVKRTRTGNISIGD